MALIKTLVPLATLLVVAYCSEISLFYIASFIPFDIPAELDSACKSYLENTTNRETYEAVLNEARSCYNNLTYGNESICHSIQDRVQMCSEPLVDFFVDCLPDKAKDLPPAMHKAATSLVETFCASPGDILLEALNPCLYEYVEHQGNDTKEECIAENIVKKLEKLERDIPSKTEACNTLQEIGDCYRDYVNQKCESLASKNLFLKFYNAALSPCNINEFHMMQ